MNPAELSINNRIAAWAVIVVLVAGGIMAFFDLGKLEDPNFTIKQALVITRYPGATPGQVADEVSEKIETSIQQMPQVDQIKSTSTFGLSIIEVKIKEKYNGKALPQIWDELRNRVNDVQRGLPPGAGPSMVNDSFGDVYGILISVTADGYSHAELKNLVDMLRKELLLVKNVGKVKIWGQQHEAVHVEILREKMAELKIGMDLIIRTLGMQNRITPAGAVKAGRDYIRINPGNTIVTVDDIADLEIRDPVSGRLFKLKDVAVVKKGYIEPPETIMRYNGRQALALGISIVPGGNIINLGKAVRKRLKELESRIPIGFELNYINFQPHDVSRAIGSFVINFIEAVVIVIIVLLIFMGLKSGLLIGAILALTVFGTFIVMKIFGIDLQRISLGALVVALGMLVDNAIVITEGIQIRMGLGDNRLKAAKKVVAQNLMPLLGATIISVLAFASIGLSNNCAGEFTRSLFYVMFISLMLSWVIAVTITPMLCHNFLTVNPLKGKTEQPYKGVIFSCYKKLLFFCLQFKWITIAVMLAMLITSLYGFFRIKGSFFPPSTRPQFLIHYYLPQGSDIQSTSRDIKELEKHLLADDRIVSVTSFTGESGPRFMLTLAMETTPTKSYGMIMVRVKDTESTDSLISELTQYMAVRFPDAEPKIKKLMIGPPTNAGIEVRFSGPDPDTLRKLAARAEHILRTTLFTTSIRNDWRNKVKVIRPEYSEINGQNAGVSKSDFNAALALATTGTTVGLLREKDMLLPIILQYPENERNDAGNLSNVQIFSSATRKSVPLTQVSLGIKTGFIDALVRKQDRKYTITVSCEPVQGVLASEIFSKIKHGIESIPLSDGYGMEWGGEFESSRDARASISENLPVTFLIMLFILILLFNSIRLPFIIFLTIPLALTGVSAGLLATGLPFSFMALLGFLSLTGMLIKNSIVLIDEINIDINDGCKPEKAIIHACLSRMRPVAMAAVTTVLGMVPLVTDQFFNGMAVTIMSGLSFATILTLIVIPVLYALVFGVDTSSFKNR